MEKIYSSLQNSELTPTQFLANKLLEELVKRHMTICIAEGCTGGSILNNLTIPGSTRAFHVGIVAYSIESKLALGVPKRIIDKYGVFSKEVAASMAEAASRIRDDTLAIASVGDIDPCDKSLPRFTHIAYSLSGKYKLTKTILLPGHSRRSIKEDLADIAFSNAIMLIQGQENLITDDYSLVFNKKREETWLTELQKATVVIQALKKRGFKISLMESCTGGAIVDTITDIPGASQVLISGLIAYDENIKAKFGVPTKAMAYGNVYSKEVAFEMAKAVMRQTDSDVAIATTGAMNTTDTRPFHTDARPGTVYIAISIRNQETLLLQLHIKLGTRTQMKREIINKVFDLLIEKLSF